MLYRILKPILKLAVRVYFKRIRISNIESASTDRPIIFAPNHHSAFMDPVVLAAYISKPLYFLARGEMFNNFFINNNSVLRN